MSGYRTHALIGAVGGLATYRLLDRYSPVLQDIEISAFNHSYRLPQLAIAGAIIVGSAVLALWPDIDQPGSRISELFQKWLGPLLFLFFGATCIIMGKDLPQTGLIAFIGLATGIILAMPILYLIHEAAGGHRKLTHSLILQLPLWAIGLGASHYGLWLVALIMICLALGQLFHLVGDIVTPGGVPIFYPLSSWEFHALPPGVSEIGEPLIGALVLCLGAGLILV